MANVIVNLNNTTIEGVIVEETQSGIVYVKSGNDTFKFFRGINDIQEVNEIEAFLNEEDLDWQHVDGSNGEAYMIFHSAEWYDYTIWLTVEDNGFTISTSKTDDEDDANVKLVKKFSTVKNFIKKVTAR